MKDDKKTRELAESICYQEEEYGNQDVAPARYCRQKKK